MDKLPSTFKFIRLLGWLYISFLALISIFYFGVYVNSDTGLTIEYFVIFIIEIAFVAIGVRYFIAGFSKILIYLLVIHTMFSCGFYVYIGLTPIESVRIFIIYLPFFLLGAYEIVKLYWQKRNC